jgi:hypothetical protein
MTTKPDCSHQFIEENCCGVRNCILCGDPETKGNDGN